MTVALWALPDGDSGGADGAIYYKVGKNNINNIIWMCGIFSNQE
jgi:hypothetical protein